MRAAAGVPGQGPLAFETRRLPRCARRRCPAQAGARCTWSSVNWAGLVIANHRVGALSTDVFCGTICSTSKLNMHRQNSSLYLT